MRTMPLLLKPFFRKFYGANFHGGKGGDEDAVRGPQHAAHFDDEGAVQNAGERRRPLQCTSVSPLRRPPPPPPPPPPARRLHCSCLEFAELVASEYKEQLHVVEEEVDLRAQRQRRGGGRRAKAGGTYRPNQVRDEGHGQPHDADAGGTGARWVLQRLELAGEGEI
jgi:hypothetical protein